MRSYALALAAICILAVVAIWMLRPDPAVRFEAEVLRLEPDEALEILRRTEPDVAFTQNLHLMHARLARADGAIREAHDAYERVLMMSGANPNVLDELAEIAVIEGNLPGAAALKQQAQTLAPDPERRQALGYWYRILGDRDSERSLLADTQPRRLTPFERERLGELYLASGDVDAYRNLLTQISGAGDESAMAARRQLIELAIEAGNPRAALDLALDWAADTPDDAAGVEDSLRALLGRGAVAEATALADYVLARDPDLGAVPLRMFTETGHGGIARQVQNSWLAHDPVLDEEDWRTLALTAERSGDLTGLRHALQRSTDDADPPADVFLQFLRYQGARSLIPYQAMMTEKIFAEMPLIGAAWFGWQRRPQLTYDYLVDASARPLTDWDRSIWMSIANDLRGTPFYRSLLAGVPSDTGIQLLLRSSVLSPVTTSDASGPVPTAD
jgi:tetratricopeptide (TPR) repeat protein